MTKTIDANSIKNQSIKEKFVGIHVYQNVGRFIEFCLANPEADDNPIEFEDLENFFAYPEYNGVHASFDGGTEEEKQAEIERLNELFSEIEDSNIIKYVRGEHYDSKTGQERKILSGNMIKKPFNSVKVGDIVSSYKKDKNTDLTIFFEVKEIGPWGVHDNAIQGYFNHVDDGKNTDINVIAPDGYEVQDEINELEYLDREPQEIYEWYTVSSYLFERLQEKGQVVADIGHMYIWGRGCTGQAVLLDNVISEICSEMEILEGQSNEWKTL